MHKGRVVFGAMESIRRTLGPRCVGTSGATPPPHTPRSLREVKVVAKHLDRIAQAAMAMPWVPSNLRKVEGPAQVHEILDMAA